MKKNNFFNEDLTNDIEEVQVPISKRESMEKAPRNAKVVNCNFLNVRDSITHDANVKKTIKNGTLVIIIDDIDDKCKIIVDGITGYVPYKFLSEV